MFVSCCSSQPFWNGVVIPSRLLAVRHTTTSSIWENCSTETDLIQPAWLGTLASSTHWPYTTCPAALSVVCKSFLYNSSPPHLGYVWKIIFIIKFKSTIFCYQCENHLHQKKYIYYWCTNSYYHCEIFYYKIANNCSLQDVHHFVGVHERAHTVLCAYFWPGLRITWSAATCRQGDEEWQCWYSSLVPRALSQVNRCGENAWELQGYEYWV